MKKTYIIAGFLLFTFCITAMAQEEWAIIVHGGAGRINPEVVPPPAEAMYREALGEALDIGSGILDEGGSSLDAVEAVIRYLEDNILFNAGKGAVLNEKGAAELDASIMDGRNLQAGAVGGVTDIRHPITASRKVMEETEHVLLAGEGASEFARELGLEMVDPSYFLEKKPWDARLIPMEDPCENKAGTVGCVALDQEGNLAAGTSTGGRRNKKYGRIGDSPIIGAGTYASNHTCAVSCTGEGEYFIRYAIAFDVHALMDYKAYPVQDAAYDVIHNKLTGTDADGGVIVLDNAGNMAIEFNTDGMFRAFRNSSGLSGVEVF